MEINNLKMFLWNANGLIAKTGEVRIFLEKYNVDILAINETKLSPDKILKIKNYDIIRKDRDNFGRGVAFLVKNNIQVLQLHDKKLSHLELLQIKINSQLTVTTWYNPPDCKIKTLDLDTIFKQSGKHILLGDLNSKNAFWSKSAPNTNGNILYNYMNQHNVTIIYPDDPTHYPNNGNNPSTVDIAIAKNLSGEAMVLHELCSDHLPVRFNLHNITYPQESNRTRLDYKNANWDLFRANLNSNIKIPNQMCTTENIDQQIEILVKTIKEAMQKSINKNKQSKNKKQIPAEIY